MSFIRKILNKLLVNKNERDLKEVRKFLVRIKEEEKKISLLSDDGLRNKTHDLKKIIKDSTKKFDKEEEKFLKKIQEKFCSISVLQKIYSIIEDIREKRYQIEQKELIHLLPQAFALIKETARRLKENKKLVVNSTFFDKELSQTKSYVLLNENKAIWRNKWDAYGKSIVWDMVHYDVQLMGGVVLHQGKIAEMATGEGKTFVATLSAYLNALSGRGVHIVTVNNYLSRRDTGWMAPLMEFHGLKVDCIDNYSSSDVQKRKKAYQADITYGTNNEFCFDYLRDNMASSKEELVQRELNYAIIDEIDSVLIDEARTPLIISGPVDPKKDNKKEFELFKGKVENLVNKQNTVVNNFLQEAKNLIKNGDKKLGGLKLFQAHRGLPKKKSLIKFLSEDNIRFILQKTESLYLQDYGREMYKVDKDLYFVIDEKNNTVELTDKGIEFLSRNVEDVGFFVLPDVNVELADLESNKLSKEKEIKEKEKLLVKIFTIKSQRIHTINQLLKAFTLFERDVDYVVLEGKVKIVDEQTGRIMEGRRYSDGLHQAIEAKENVKIESSSQTFATITLQNYFRMYRKISGMTGTAETESGEFWHIYKLDVVVIPTHQIVQRKDLQDLVFKTKREKYNAIIEKIIHLSIHEKRPVLVGTTSVEVSEFLSRALKFRKIPHNVLNAKLHDKEADIIAKAGLVGSVTIATNMAGRGTDIKLSKEVIKNGGLSVLGTERHDSRRVDNQLRGRSGRQGDPGSSQFYVSLEDDLIRLFIDSERLSRLMDRFGHKEGDIIQHPLLTKSIEKAQKKIEDNNFSMRKRLLDYDDVINKQREFIYKKRKNALCESELSLDISNMVYILLDVMISVNKSLNDFKNLEYEFIQIFDMKFPFQEKEFFSYKERVCVNKLHDIIINFYDKKKENMIHKDIMPIISNIIVNNKEFYQIQVIFTDGIQNIVSTSDLKEFYKTEGRSLLSIFEKKTILCFMDDKWKEHLREMDSLRYSVQNAVFEQKDPLIVYKQNAFNLFQERVYDINKKIVSFLLKSTIMRGDILCIPKNNIKMDLLMRSKNRKKLGRNNRISIRHLITGETKNIKFKQAEFFLEQGEWVIEDDSF
ncbi:preprotein translocase subunit SecA [Blattabacterium sp. (Blattella germanica) str. Bge]|uniref:preprotein translocase subunit SecA n=1 Tax=Blattabacterium sp. (Blattella germanica) TaxID=624186 RepID=UPI0001BB62D7|nr:preprotein translocase subunit SecA [Blattabacterium sp. (Blattella germanica)]ACY40087.1 preprotein translocase subunit SecA [Blattabacterium sp. (Blattella germanica) str. Bge]